MYIGFIQQADKLEFEEGSAGPEQHCHSKPVRTLVWESPSNLRLYSPKDGDCHTSDVGHWFAMTGNSITRQIPISRTAALTADKRKNGIGRWYTPFFRFGMKLWEGATEKAFPGHPEQSDGRTADTQQLHFRDK